MTDIESRIRQFQQMTDSDPENELGHFSLARAYLEANHPDKAIAPLERVLQIRPTMSKAYQLLGEAYHRVEDSAAAIEIMTRGVRIADEQGDYMPRDTMIGVLRDWGHEVPGVKGTSPPPASAEPSDHENDPNFRCARCGQPGGRLPRRPFKGSLGETIFDRVCHLCWQEWIAMGTKVINELGLTLSSKEGQDTYDQYMIEFLQLEPL